MFPCSLQNFPCVPMFPKGISLIGHSLFPEVFFRAVFPVLFSFRSHVP